MSTPPTATPRTQALWMKHHAFSTEEEATEALCDFRDHGNALENELARLRADLERFTGHGLLDCHAICDQRDAAVAERDRLRAELAAVQAQHLHEVDELAAQAKIMNELRTELGNQKVQNNHNWQFQEISEEALKRAEIAENWSDHHASHADDLIAENVKLRAEVERLKALGSWAHTCIHHTDDERKAWVACPCCANARAEKAEDELKQMQSSALTWARFAGDKSACADLADQRARLTERLWKEFITLMDITEESDSGNAFNPNKISSCRAMDGKRLNEILIEARQIVF